MADIKKYYLINADPSQVYLALTTETTIELWTGHEAKMSTEPGSDFELWDGSIVGKNIEFEQDKKIVQHWYFGDEQNPSIVTIKLHADKHGTSVELRHTNIPDSELDDMLYGWNNYYFGALEDFFDE